MKAVCCKVSFIISSVKKCTLHNELQNWNTYLKMALAVQRD